MVKFNYKSSLAILAMSTAVILSVPVFAGDTTDEISEEKILEDLVSLGEFPPEVLTLIFHQIAATGDFKTLACFNMTSHKLSSIVQGDNVLKNVLEGTKLILRLKKELENLGTQVNHDTLCTIHAKFYEKLGPIDVDGLSLALHDQLFLLTVKHYLCNYITDLKSLFLKAMREGSTITYLNELDRVSVQLPVARYRMLLCPRVADVRRDRPSRIFGVLLTTFPDFLKGHEITDQVLDYAELFVHYLVTQKRWSNDSDRYGDSIGNALYSIGGHLPYHLFNQFNTLIEEMDQLKLDGEPTNLAYQSALTGLTLNKNIPDGIVIEKLQPFLAEGRHDRTIGQAVLALCKRAEDEKTICFFTEGCHRQYDIEGIRFVEDEIAGNPKYSKK